MSNPKALHQSLRLKFQSMDCISIFQFDFASAVHTLRVAYAYETQFLNINTSMYVLNVDYEFSRFMDK